MSGIHDIATRTTRKIIWRLVPFLAVLYMFNIIDRANVSFARLAMTTDLGLSDAVIDLGYGLFFVGYLLFEVPSNLLLRRFGARKWISRIMVSWGLVSMMTAWVDGATSYYWARILLGVAEAGFFPGIIFYLTAWFPASLRARVVAWFMLAIPLANIIGNPISGAIMDTMSGVGGLAGWQWLFVLEGIPSVLLGCSVLWLLPDHPRDAAWLDADERDWLEAEIEREAGGRREGGGSEKLSAMADPRVWVLIGLYASVAIGTNATGAYLPKLVKGHFEPMLSAGTESAGQANLFWKIGLLSSLPHLASVLAMLLMSRISDLSRKRALPAAAALTAAGCGWLVGWRGENPWLALAGLCLAQAGMMAVLPVFWTLPPLFLGGAAAAAGIALINSVANIGGIFAPSVIGRFGVGPMAGVMVWGVAMAVAAWWIVERRAHGNQPQ